MYFKTLRRAAVAAAATLTLAGAGVAAAMPSGAATMPAPNVRGANVSSLGQTGYSATNAQFQTVHGTVFLRAPGQYAGELTGAGGSVSLWASDGSLVQLGISATTGGFGTGLSGYSAGVAPFNSSHQQIGGVITQGDANFPAGESVTLTMKYDRLSGLMNMTEQDATHTFRATFDAGAGKSFNQARVTSDFGNSPFDSVGYKAAPPAQMKYLSWSNAGVTNYNGKSFTLWGFFTHHKLILVGAPGGATPSALGNSGASFSTFLQP